MANLIERNWLAEDIAYFSRSGCTNGIANGVLNDAALSTRYNCVTGYIVRYDHTLTEGDRPFRFFDLLFIPLFMNWNEDHQPFGSGGIPGASAVATFET
jgi:hypothetical protein